MIVPGWGQQTLYATPVYPMGIEIVFPSYAPMDVHVGPKLRKVVAAGAGRGWGNAGEYTKRESEPSSSGS